MLAAVERGLLAAEEVGLLAAEERRLLIEIQVTLLTTKKVADSRAVAESRATWSLVVQLKREESGQEGQIRLLKAEDKKQARGTNKENSTGSKERQG